MTEQWQELKETITEMRDNDGTGTQQDACKFLANYMETLEKQMQEPCEDCISREAVRELICQNNDKYGYSDRFHEFTERCLHLAIRKPQFTDEEIDKVQAVEQAYVDKMVELAVAEVKERYSNAVKKAKKAIDEMTEIHSDGEFYIKNVDAKWIISKYLCGAKEKPKGRWIATENEEMNIVGYYCSCCDLPMETEEKTKYCPNCGAEMSGGGEDEDSD